MVSNIYVNDEGKLVMTKGGADSVLPFNSKEVYIPTLDCSANGGNANYNGTGYTDLILDAKNCSNLTISSIGCITRKLYGLHIDINTYDTNGTKTNLFTHEGGIDVGTPWSNLSYALPANVNYVELYIVVTKTNGVGTLRITDIRIK